MMPTNFSDSRRTTLIGKTLRAVAVSAVCLLLGLGSPCCQGAATSVTDDDSRHKNWEESLLRLSFDLLSVSPSRERSVEDNRATWERFQLGYPIAADWLLQDGLWGAEPDFARGPDFNGIIRMIDTVLGELQVDGVAETTWKDRLLRDQVPTDTLPWWSLYVRACEKRRTLRLNSVAQTSPRIVFVKRRTIRPSFFAYTEGQSDAQNERHFLPGSALCLWDATDTPASVTTLLEDPHGVIRDPAVSWDGNRIVFAWKKSLNEDDYHLYEMDVASRSIRQLTFGLGFADYEPAFLPGGDLVFSSTRCVQTVDCWWTEVSNLYTCDADGAHLRRLGFDQVHTVFPTVLEDGRVVYTRWDYNDRGQVFPQALFQMNPDGTGQSEFYGNNSWFPTTITHARGIPGTQKIMATFCGHHTPQSGKVGVIDPSLGRQENAGTQLIAPIRPTPAERIDAYGQQGAQFRYPFPLSETEFLVTFAPLGWAYRHGHFGIYWMDTAGRRELLAFDREISCHQSVPLRSRAQPPVRPSQVDYRRKDGTYYLQDVYEGPGLRGVRPGAIDRLRVIALDFRAAGIGNNFSQGPGGGALVSTPIAVGNGSWDIKVVLGDARVHPDGSAFFKAPARTPLYFQAIDTKGRAIQTMRSWTTLQPGENAACVGCHESKNSTPPGYTPGPTAALRAGPQALQAFYGPARGFSFAQEIQPILDRHCIRCHNDRSLHRNPDLSHPPNAAIAPVNNKIDTPSFSLLSEPVLDKGAKRFWSDAYLALTGAQPREVYAGRDAAVGKPNGRLVNWISSQSVPEPLPPASNGAIRSELMRLLQDHHYGVQLNREELDKIACWIDLLVPFCGDYTEANAWTVEEKAKYEHFLNKRKQMEALEQENTASGRTGRRVSNRIESDQSSVSTHPPDLPERNKRRDSRPRSNYG